MLPFEISECDFSCKKSFSSVTTKMTILSIFYIGYPHPQPGYNCRSRARSHLQLFRKPWRRHLLQLSFHRPQRRKKNRAYTMTLMIHCYYCPSLGSLCVFSCAFFYFLREVPKEDKEEKKEIIQFKNKKEAIEAFKMLLKDKVNIPEVQNIPKL